MCAEARLSTTSAERSDETDSKCGASVENILCWYRQATCARRCVVARWFRRGFSRHTYFAPIPRHAANVSAFRRRSPQRSLHDRSICIPKENKFLPFRGLVFVALADLLRNCRRACHVCGCTRVSHGRNSFACHQRIFRVIRARRDRKYDVIPRAEE